MFHQLAERGFRYADELDYLVRGWVIPDHPSQASRSPGNVSKRSDGVLSEASIGNRALSPRGLRSGTTYPRPSRRTC
jgi:hypothetical protein